jgi:hypothetical protein
MSGSKMAKRSTGPAAVDYRFNMRHVDSPREYPAPERLFTAVAALQHLTDAHDADHVSPPPIWPMVLHGAMPNELIFVKDEADLEALQLCFVAITSEWRILVQIAMRSAIRIVTQRRSITTRNLRRDEHEGLQWQRTQACKVLFDMVTGTGASSPVVRREAALLLGRLSDDGDPDSDFNFFSSLARVSLNHNDGEIGELCFESMWCMLTCSSILPYTPFRANTRMMIMEADLLRDFIDRLRDKILETASPSACKLLLAMAKCELLTTSPYTPTLQCCLQQLAEQPAKWDPVHLWFMAEALTCQGAVRDIAMACVPFPAVLQMVEMDLEYAQLALCILGRAADLGYPPPASLIARIPRLLTHDDPIIQYFALRILSNIEAARDASFFVDNILPVIHKCILTPLTTVNADSLSRLTRCPAVSTCAITIMGGYEQTSVSSEAICCVLRACAASRVHTAIIVPALRESPTFTALLTVVCSNDRWTSPTDEAAMMSYKEATDETARIAFEAVTLVANAGYAAAAHAAGPVKWQQLINRVAGTLFGDVDLTLAMAILENESATIVSRVLFVMRSFPGVSLQHVTKIVQCCAITDASVHHLAAGWRSLQVILDESKLPRGEVTAIVLGNLPLLLSALRHPSAILRAAAARFAGSLVRLPTFPSSAREAVLDAMTETLTAIRLEHEAALASQTLNAAASWRVSQSAARHGTSSQQHDTNNPFMAAARTRLGPYTPEQRPMYIATIEATARQHNISNPNNAVNDGVCAIIVVIYDCCAWFPLPERFVTSGAAFEIARVAIAYHRSRTLHTECALDILGLLHRRDGTAFVSRLSDDVYLAVAALETLRVHRDLFLNNRRVDRGAGHRRPPAFPFVSNSGNTIQSK